MVKLVLTSQAFNESHFIFERTHVLVNNVNLSFKKSFHKWT